MLWSACEKILLFNLFCIAEQYFLFPSIHHAF